MGRGAALSRRLHARVLAPALAGVPHAAGLLGPGSEVLGYDDDRSTDHDWAPGATVLLADGTPPDELDDVRRQLLAALPEEFEGWPTRAGSDRNPVAARVVVSTTSHWVRGQLGVDVPAGGPDALTWLALPQQLLLQVVAGPVWRDDLGELTAVRTALAGYPDDVRWWLLASAWHRLASQEPLPQRAAEVGDALGADLARAAVVRTLVDLAMLQHGRFTPYAKWRGTAFAAAEADRGQDDGLAARLRESVAGPDDDARSAAVAAASELVARRHAELPGATALDPGVRPFHDRPALVLHADRFAEDCLARVADPVLRALPLVGGVDQLAGGSAELLRAEHVPRTRAMYASLAG